MAATIPPLKPEEIKFFIANGYLVIPPSPDRDGNLHRSIFQKAESLGPRAEELGNNILPAVTKHHMRLTPYNYNTDRKLTIRCTLS